MNKAYEHTCPSCSAARDSLCKDLTAWFNRDRNHYYKEEPHVARMNLLNPVIMDNQVLFTDTDLLLGDKQ